jgi:hypothetical protein
MKLRMVRELNGCWRERLLCDYCHQPIDNPLLAMVVWLDPAGWEDGHPGEVVEPKIVHKGRCDETNFGIGVEHHPWSELSTVLERLLERKALAQTGAAK